MVESMELTDCVARGAALLDEQREGWHEQIELVQLRMESTWDCILGQLFDGFENGLCTLFPDADSTAKRHARAIEHGFDTEGDYEELGKLWREEVDQRWS